MENKKIIGNDSGNARGRYLDTKKKFEETMSEANSPLQGVTRYSDYQYSTDPSQELEPEQNIVTDEVKEPDLSNESRVSSVVDKAKGALDSINEFFGLGDIKKDYQAAPTMTMGQPEKESKGITAAVADVAATSGVNSADGMFAFLNGIIDTRISSKQGDLLRNNIDLQEKLDFIKNTVSKAQEAKEYENQLNTVEDNPEEFNRIHNAYENARLEYLQMKPTSDQYLQEMHDKNKDINDKSEITNLRNAKDLINYLDATSDVNHKEIESKIDDINEEQGSKRYINSIYQISPEYQENQQNMKFAWTDPKSWYHTVPQTLGSSFGFMEATAAATVASFAGNYLLKQLPKLGMTGGASLLPGLIVSVGASAGNVWANIVARQQESNAEVYDNYKQRLYNAVDENKINLEAVLQEGAQKLKEQAGVDISNKTSDEILNDMIAYNIKVSNPDFETIKSESRKDMDKLYDQNMALAASDVMQSLLVVPGAGKLMTKVLTANGKVRLGEDLSKFAGKFLDTTTRSIATNMAKIKTVPILGKVAGKVTQAGLKRVVTKGLTPMAKLGISSVGEMNEEGVQYIQGERFAKEQYAGQSSNIFKGLASNVDASIDAFAGLLGVSSDPALNNDEDLAQNMKLGAVTSIFIGGGSQVLAPGEHNVVKKYVDDIAGSKVANKLTADVIRAREDMETIKRYAADGINNTSKREGYISQLESMKNSLPPGLDAEDIDVEINRAKRVFSLLEDPMFDSTASDLGITKGSDDYNNYLAFTVRADENAKLARDMYRKEKSDYDNIWNSTNVNEFFDDRSIPSEQRPIYSQYIKLNTERRALEDFVNGIEKFNGTNDELSKKYGFTYNPKRSEDYLYEAMMLRSEAINDINKLEKDFKEQFNGEFKYDRIDDNDVDYNANTKLPSVLLNGIRAKELTQYSDAFKGIKSMVVFGKSKTKRLSLINNVLNNYKDVQTTNDLINQALTTPEPEQAVQEVTDETLNIDPEAGKRKYEERILNKGRKKQQTLADRMTKPTRTKPVAQEEAEIEQVEEKTEGEKQIEESISPRSMGGVTITPSIEEAKPITVEEPILKPVEEVKPADVVTPIEPEKVAEKPLEQAVEPSKPTVKTSESIFDAVSSVQDEIPFDPYSTLYGEEDSPYIPTESGNIDELPEQEPQPEQVSDKVIDAGQGKSAQAETPVTVEEEKVTEAVNPFDAVPSGTAEGMDMITPAEETPSSNPDEAPIESPYTADLKRRLEITDSKPTDESTFVGTITPDESTREFGLTSGTVYFTGEAMFPGYENAESFDTFLSQPDALDEADVQIKVGKPGDKYSKKFNPADRSTWDDAAIYVTVDKKGKKYAGALKTPIGATQQYAKSGKEVDAADIKKLSEFRNKIIEAYVADPNTTIKPKVVKRTNGLFNVNRDKEGKAINRPLTQITGFNIPKDVRELNNSGIKFGIGRGSKNNFYIVDDTGHMLPGVGNSGKVYIYSRPQDTPSKFWAPPIKLNELKFSDRPDLTDLLYNAFVEQGNTGAMYKFKSGNKTYSADFTNNDLVKFLINEGEHTLVHKGDRDEFGYLTSKQFYYNFNNDTYIIGDNIWKRSQLLTPQGKAEFLKYVNENLHVNTDEETIYKKLPYEFYTTLYNNKDLKELRLSDSLVFTKDDFDTKFDEYTEELQTFGKSREGIDSLTQLQWMIKNGWLMSDLNDQLYKSPFMYVNDIEVETSPQTKQQSAAIIADENNPVKGENNVFLEDEELMRELGLDLRVPKKVADEKATKENTERAKKWLMGKLGLEEDQVTVGDAYLRAAANGTVVMGTTYRDTIALAEASVPGTGYHEAFHRVSTLLLSKSQQDKLYEEYKRRHPEYAKATDLTIEEALAEDFRDFMLKREKPLYSILKWFNPIATFVRKMFRPDSMTTIYNMISDGDFSKYKMSPERYNEFNNAYKDGLNFTVGEGENEYSPKAFTDLYDYYNSTIPALAATLLLKSKVQLLQDVDKIDTSLLRDYLKAQVERARNPMQKSAIQEILDHFDTVFMPDVMKELERFSIRAVDRDRDQEMEDKDAVNVQVIQNYDKAAYEVSKKDNALASAKMFIATIPKINFVYQDIDGVKVRSTRPELDPITGMPTFIDFDTSWNLVLSNLYNVETYQDMIDKSQELSNSSPFFFQLNKRLARVTDTNLQTQLLQTVKSNKHNMFTVKYGQRPAENGRSVQIYWTVDDSGADKAALSYPTAWSQTFYNSSLVNISEEGSSINTKEIEAVKDKYTSMAADITNKGTVLTDAKVDTIVAELVALLNKIGITIDKETIESAITDPKVSIAGTPRAEAITKLVTDTRKGSISYIFTNNLPELAQGPKEHKTSKGTNVRTLSNVYEGLGKNSVIGLLAKHYAQLHPNPEEIMVLGANNNLLYPISQNCYMSDQVRWLNQRGDALEQLSQVTYCKNSLIRDALTKNHDIKLNTFVNFKSELGGDKGRDYMQISPVEDYLAKMALTANNHIILPTMADKKMYFTISGVRLFNDPIQITETPNGSVLNFSRDVILQFQKIGLDEINTIIEFYNNKEKVAANKDLKVKNYHSGNLGGRFRHFTHITKSVNGKTELISLNDILDKAEKEGTIQQKLESLRKALFSKTSDNNYVHNTINGMLKYLLATEVATAEKLGIITRKDGIISNNTNSRDKNTVSGLDQARFDAFVEHFNKTPNTQYFANHYAALSMIGNYAINSALSIIEVEKIFSGDPAFYKSADDKIKRLSEVLSTGDNLRLDWPAGHRLDGRTQFTATELNDNEIASHQFDELKELFTRSYARKYIKEFYGVVEDQLDARVSDDNSRQVYPDAWKEADKTAAVAVSAYGFNTKKNKGNINQADAAVYVSPKMYKDMMEMLGEWSPEIEKAYSIMESDEDWLSNPKLYHESLEALIKPLKMMYYGQHLIPELNIQVPIFDKMAMFPMFKVMATGDNRELYNRMNGIDKYAGQRKIDMVAFGSAIKVGSRSPGNFYTDAHNNVISDLSKLSIFNQDFKYLRRQLITDPHHAERQMLGTQAAKAALSNIVMDRTYGLGKEGEKLSGKDIKDTAFACMQQLSNLGRKRILEEIGSNEEVDVKKLSEYLIRNAKSKGMGSEIIDGLQIVDGKFKIPLSALSDSKWLESAMVGFTNKEAIDINTPGGAFIQMSSFGFKSITTVSDRVYNNGNRLNMHNPDGSMDAMVSINLFSHMIPNYSRISYTQAKQWLIDNDIIGTSKYTKAVAMGYRIPTQGLSSISALRVVDVFPSNIGDTIMLPDEFTALTGSDFDIDKLYVARYNYETYEGTDGTVGKDGLLRTVKKARRVAFEPELGFENNSREALENRLLDMYIMMLTDNSNIDETRLPLDNTTSIVKDEILPIVDGPSTSKGEYSFKYASPTFQLNKKYEYSGGKNGIAPFALNNVHHVLTQLMGLRYKDSKILNMFGFGTLDGIDSKEERVISRSEDGEILYDDNGRPITDIDRGERILDWLSAMINAHVDVAKDPYIIRLNVCQWTYNMSNFLLRSGFGRDTFFFLPQPILKDIAAEVQRLDGSYGVDTSKSRSQLEKEAIETIVDRYYEKAKSLAKDKVEIDFIDNIYNNEVTSDKMDVSKVMTRDFLIDTLIDNRYENKKSSFYTDQLKIWKVFEALTPYAKEMSELVNLSQVDTKKFGNNFNLQRRFLYRLKDYILNNKVFDRQDIAAFFRNSFLDTKIRNSVLFNGTLFNGLTITSSNQFIDQVERTLKWIGMSKTKDETVIKIVSNEIEASVKADFFNKYSADNGIDINGMYYGSNNMAARLSRIKTDILLGKYKGLATPNYTIKNELLNYLSSEFKQVNEAYDAPNIITVPRTKSNDKYLEKRLTKYWEELLNSQYPEIAQFAKDLVVYSFYSSGDNYNKNSFFNLVPNSYRQSIGYTDAIEDSIDQLNQGSFHTGSDMVFTNTWYNNNLVRETTLKGNDSALLSVEAINGLRYPVLITKPVVEGRAFTEPIGINKDGQPIFKPYYKINLDSSNNPQTTILYKYIGYYFDEKLNDNVPIYAAVNKKGLYLNGKVVREFNNASESILPFNNLPFKYEDGNIFETEDAVNKKGKTIKKFTRISPSSREHASDWYRRLRDMSVVTDYTVNDIVNNVSYEDVINGNFPKNASDKTDVVVPINSTISIADNLVKPTGNESSNKFTFPNGMSINTPFALNSQQESALTELAKFVENPALSNNEVTLTGYAGTGKTTLIGLFDQYLRYILLDQPKYTAVTYRANAVTKMNNSNADTYTLNQLFGISAETDISDSRLDMRKIRNEQKYRPKIAPQDLIIVDEASMVSPAFYEFIQEAKNRYGIKVIYVGDPAQLSPVDGSKEISPVFSGKKGKVIQLTKVERTGDNPILAEATSLREGNDLSYVTRLNDKGEGVIYTNSEEEATKFINDAFNSQEFADNKLYFRVLSAVNDQISIINNNIRKALFGDDAKQLEVGDILMGYDNINISGMDEPDIINSGDYEVMSSKPSTVTVVLPTKGDFNMKRAVVIDTFEVKLTNILDRDKSVIVNIASNQVPFAVAKDITNELEMLYNAKRLAWQNRQRSIINSIDEAIDDIRTSFISMKEYKEGDKVKVKKALDYGYAHTIHKSQGGTYNKVLIYADTIDRFRDAKTRQQLKYVAVSRAKENVAIFTDRKLGTTEEVKPTDKFAQLKQEEQGANKYSVPTTKVISGAQTGVDRIGLEIGKELGIETGGTATPGYWTEKGKDLSIKDFGVTEISQELQAGKSGKEFYLPRTEQNVLNSDGTVYFATKDDSAGKIATERFAKKHNKPFLLNPTSDKLNKWLNENNIQTLNVAGNRGSKLTEQQKTNIGNIIRNAFSLPIQQELFSTANPFDATPSSNALGEVQDFTSDNIYYKMMSDVQQAKKDLFSNNNVYNNVFYSNMRKMKDTRTAIQYMIDNGYVMKRYRKLAELLMKHSTSLTVLNTFSDDGTMAYYNLDSSNIYLHKNSFRQRPEMTAADLLHEVLHHYLGSKYELDADYKKTVDRMQSKYRSLASEEEMRGIYGLYASGEEFVNEALTNPYLMKWMQTKDGTLWERFKRFIAKAIQALGFKNATAYNLNDITEELTALVETVSNRETPLSADKYSVEELERAENGLHAAVMRKVDSEYLRDLEKEANVTKTRIQQGIESRIKSFKQYGKVTSNRVMMMEQELGKLQELWQKNEDKVAMVNFIKHAADEARKPVDSIDAAFEEYKTDGKFSLRNNQLIQIYRDFIGFYEPIIKDINDKLFDVGYFDDLNETDLEILGNRLNGITQDFSRIKSKYSMLLASRFGDVLIADAKKYGMDETTIRAYVDDNKNYTSNDISLYHTYIGGMRNTKDKTLNIVARKVTDLQNEIERQTVQKAADILPVFQAVSGTQWQLLYEKDDKGKKTGYLVRDLNYGKFYRDRDAYFDSLGEAPIGDAEKLKEWYTKRNNWLSEHAERRYKPEYYDLFNNMSFAARTARDGIQFEISKLLTDYMDKQGNVHVERIPNDDWNRLQALYQEKRRLANRYNNDGTKKEGIDLEIAEELIAINEKLNNNLSYKSNKKRFEKIRAEKESSLSPDEYKRWYDRSTRWAYAEEFQEKLDKIEKKYYNEEYENLSKERRELMGLYRNTHDFMINTKLMPESVKDRIRDIDHRMDDIRDTVKSAQGKEEESFSDLASIVKSNYYKAEKQHALEEDKKTPGYYKEWQSANHYIDNRGRLQAYSYFNLMIPNNKDYMEIVPSREFTEIDPSSPYWNDNYNVEDSEGYQPKRDLYDNAEAYNKVASDDKLKAIHDTVVNTMSEANDKITFLKHKNNYKLPQISGGTWAYIKANNGIFNGIFKYAKDKYVDEKDDDVEFNYQNLAPDGQPLDTIPTHYMKMLSDPATITNNLAGAIMAYYNMSVNFEMKQEVLPELKIVQNQVQSRQVQEATIDKVLGSIKWLKLNKRSRSDIRLERYMENNIFGNQYNPIRIGKVNIVKMLLGLKNYATLVNLGANIFVASANVMGSWHQHFTEALVGVYYTPRTALTALRNCTYNFGKMLLNAGNYTHENKLLSLMNYNQIARDNSNVYRRLNYNRFARFLMNNLWYGMMSAGDMFTKGQILTSVYLNTKYVPEHDRFMMRDEYLRLHKDDKKAGNKFSRINTVTLYDMYDAKGVDIVLSSKQEKYHKYVTSELTSKVTNVIKYLTQRADGMMDSSDKNFAQANAIISFAFMHKNFIMSAIEDRVLKPTDYNFMIERMDEAQYKTAIRRIGDILRYARDLNRYHVLRQQTEGKPKLRELEYHEKYNVKRITAEGTLIIAYLLISMMLNSDDGDDDDWATEAFKYAHDRATYEAGNLYNPWDVYNSFKTLTPAASSLDNFKTVVSGVEMLINPSSDMFKETKYGPYKGHNKLFKAAMKSTPLKNIIEATDPKSKHKYLKGQLQ